MIRHASKGFRVLSGYLRREKLSNSWLNHRNYTLTRCGGSFSTQQNGEDFPSRTGKKYSSDAPEPLVAVAYAYDFKDGLSNEEICDVTMAQHAVKHDVTRFGTPKASESGGPTGRGPSSSNPYPPPSSMASSNGAQNSKSGGGGSGRHRCPSCGTTVTFRCDNDENSFYCATCAGLFVVNPSKVHTSEESKSSESPYEGFSPHTPSDPEILMRYIPDQPKRFAPGHHGQRSSTILGREEQMEDATLIGGSAPTSAAVKRIPTPREIRRGLNEYVIGQSAVKVALSVGVYNHYKRIFVAEAQTATQSRKARGDVKDDYFPLAGSGGLSDLNLGQFGTTTEISREAGLNTPFTEVPDVNSIVDESFGTEVEDCEIDKSNIMLLGPTGSGKTHLVKTLAKLIDVPLVIADATCLTQAGYVGEDVESILLKLYLESGQDIERCQRGIVYIDETDKIRKSGANVSISRDVSGEGVQHALLKIVEGNVVSVPKEQGRKNPKADFLQIDTTNILFICGGAFSGLERIVNQRTNAASIGFGAEMRKEIDNPEVQDQCFDNVIPKDLVDFGMIPEFIGRFPVIVSTKGLDLENLVDILTVPRNSIIKQYKRLFALDDVKFHVTDCGLREIAKTAFKRGTGARGLRSIVEQVLMETQYVVPSMPDVHTVYVDAAAVRGERKPILLKDPAMTVEKYEALMKEGRIDVDGAMAVYIEDDEDLFREVAA